MMVLSRVETRRSWSPEDEAQTGVLHVQYFYIYKLGKKFSSDIHDSQRVNINGFGDFLTVPRCVVISDPVCPACLNSGGRQV